MKRRMTQIQSLNLSQKGYTPKCPVSCRSSISPIYIISENGGIRLSGEIMDFLLVRLRPQA